MAKIQVNGVNIYYELKGNSEGNEAVVFLNGIMSTVSGWAEQVSVLEKVGWKILLHDLRGQLMSEKPKSEYTFSLHAQDFKALLDHLGIKKIHIIGTSYGGVVGIDFALNNPEYMKSLILIDSLSETDANFRRLVSLWQELAKEGNMVNLFRTVVPVIYSDYYLKNNQQLLSEREALLKKVPPEFLEAFCFLLANAEHNMNYTAELKKIKCPVLLVCGENDQLTPLKLSRLIQLQIPHAEFVIVPQCGHTTIYEKPDIVNTLILGFVCKHK